MEVEVFSMIENHRNFHLSSLKQFHGMVMLKVSLQYQFDFNRLGLTSSVTDILEVVPMDVIMRDEAFVDYVRNSNNLLGEW